MKQSTVLKRVEKAPNLYRSGVQWDEHSVLALLPLIDCKLPCGKCCEHPWPIRIQGYEARRIAEYIETPLPTLLRKLEVFESDWSLPSPCPFRSDAGCAVWPARPVVCKYFPLQRVAHEGNWVVGVFTGLCEAGQPCVEQLKRWQHGH